MKEGRFDDFADKVMDLLFSAADELGGVEKGLKG